MKYIKEDLERMLKNHKDNEAKLTEVELKIEEYQERLDYAGTVYEDTDKEIIENMQLATQPYNAINSNTNKVSDKVLSTVMNYKKEQHYINEENREFLNKKLKELERDRNELNKKVVRTKNIMIPLSKEEKFVIETYYMDKSKWDYVEKLYFNEFEKYKSIKQLQTYRDNAIKTMLEIINIGA